MEVDYVGYSALIYKRRKDRRIVIDYDFCKECGIYPRLKAQPDYSIRVEAIKL